MARRFGVLGLTGGVMLAAVYVAQTARVPPGPAVPQSRLAGSVGGFGEPSATAPDPGPGECLARMLESAAARDLDGYLDCFEGEHRQRLEQLREVDRARLVEYLEAMADGLKGFATTTLTPAGADELRLVLERVYADRNETQEVRLRRSGERWRIEALGPARRALPAIRYGTPVYVPSQTQDVPRTPDAPPSFRRKPESRPPNGPRRSPG